MEVTIIPQKGVVLTENDVNILAQISEGLSSTEIAKVVLLSPRTVEAHIDKLRYKFGAKNKTHLIVLAIRAGVIK